MNKKIKKILDYLKESATKENLYFEINPEKAKILLDYITNLETIEQQYSAILSKNAELENKITNLQEENRILKENAEHNDKVVDNARWNETIYKSRNKKAIEYIDKYQKDKNTFKLHDLRLNSNELLNILTGGDE